MTKFTIKDIEGLESMEMEDPKKNFHYHNRTYSIKAIKEARNSLRQDIINELMGKNK